MCSPSHLLHLTEIASHSSHLHGHKTQIVNRVTDFTSTDPSLNPPLVEGQANPMRRDTVTIAGGGSVTLRFVADNPGAWLFHCESKPALFRVDALNFQIIQVTSNGTWNRAWQSSLLKHHF